MIIIPCLVAESMQRWWFAFSDPLWACIMVKVIEGSMIIQGIYKSTIMPSLNGIAEMLSAKL